MLKILIQTKCVAAQIQGEHTGSPLHYLGKFGERGIYKRWANCDSLLRYFIPLKRLCVSTPPSFGHLLCVRGGAFENLFHPFACRKFSAPTRCTHSHFFPCSL